MFWTIARRAAQQTQSKIPFDIYQNPYKAKRLWPPDFAKLSQKHQFRLERRYKRRAKLKWARPGWTKGVKIVQLGSILFVIVYGVLFADWSKGSASAHSPFDGIRKWFFGLTDSTLTRDTVRRRVERPNSASPVVDARK